MSKLQLANFTHYSLGIGLSKPDELIKKCVDYGFTACGISDYKSVSGVIDFYQCAKKAGIKPILGCTFDDFRLFVKNKRGWKDLLDIVSGQSKHGELNLELTNDLIACGNLIKRPLEFDAESYYINQEDQELHSILLCSKHKTTLSKIDKELLSKYSDKYLKYSDEDGSAFCDEIENFNILNSPELPQFPTPKGESEEEYLKELCRHGWEKMIVNQKVLKTQAKKDVYLNRFLKEFEVIKEANLFGYFLIVQDIINFAKKQGWMTGPGRGSAAGCLISYLLGITLVDPIEYDLIFERFYNKGRNSADHISLPDIDIDIPAHKRELIIQYVKDKYGIEHVSQMVTFGRLQGRSAIKEVFRVTETGSFSEINEITKHIPDEARISDQLEEMGDERSIIMWALLNNKNDLKDFCYVNPMGDLEGDYAPFFKKAIDIEGTFKTQGKHAAGVVVSKSKLRDVCPMVYPREGEEQLCGFEMEHLEAAGLVKLDLLGLSLLDKLMYIKEI